MRVRFMFVVSAALLSAACSDLNVANPLSDGPISGPSFAIVDADNDGPIPGFWFLPPLAKHVTTEGVLDPNLEPAMRVCLLDGNPSAEVNHEWRGVVCELGANGEPIIVAEFAPGSAELSPDSHYQFSWDTDAGAENLIEMNPDSLYRINILLGETVLGYLDVNPQRPSGETPGDDFPDLYAFRIGENLPVKIFLTPAARCAFSEDYVIQCVAAGVIDETGGVVTLEPEEAGWAKLSTVVPPGALPEGFPIVILTMERIDPVLFLAETGERCIPGLPFLVSSDFDAPQFGDCLRVTTDPELPVELEIAAIIEICLNPFDLLGIKFGEEQDRRLQIIRFDDSGVTQGLPNVDATTCGAPPEPEPDQFGFLPVPQGGPFRTAVIAMNSVARWLGPEPLVAHGGIRLGGSTSEFSRFRWGLPGEMVKVADDFVIQQLEDVSESYDLTVEVRVQDAGSPDLSLGPSTVEGATVHFSGDGTVDESDVTTGGDGVAGVIWTTPASAGVHTLDAKALGLLASPVPSHGGLIDFQEATVQFSATVVGPPTGRTQSPDPLPPLTGLPGETLTTPLTITVVDTNDEPVVGWTVTWTTTCAATNPADCDGYVTGSTETDEDGMASGLWTLATTPGANTATATVGGTTFSFEAGTWNAVGLCQIVVDGIVEEGEWDCAEAAGDVLTFTANISGGDTPAEVRWQNDGDSIYFLVRVTQSSLAKANSLRFDFDNTLNGATAGDDAIGFDAGGGGFFDEYLTARCSRRSQSGCGAVDRFGKDGRGRMENDGEYTVYELSHPLKGHPDEDFVLEQGDSLGFYLTLRIGKGAQGNTQVPGFRDYKRIKIR